MARNSSRLRVLLLATYFPKPDNPIMGNWALAQAQAFLRAGVDLRVVSPTSWVPKLLARSKGARAYAYCPPEYHWDQLEVTYPRWLLYQVGPFVRQAYASPVLQMWVGWQTVKHALCRAVETHRPELIYAHHSVVNGYLACRLQDRYGIPFVVTDHDFAEIYSCASLPKRRKFIDEVATRAAKMVCVSSRMERDLTTIFPQAKAVTVPNGTDPLPAELGRTARPPASVGKTVVFSAGAFYARKGFPVLIRAFAKIADKFPDAILRIAGDGDERAKVEEEIRSSGLGARVQLLGYQPHKVVLQEMVWADLFALIGWEEPFGVVFAEAAAARKPIIWSGDCGINDVLLDGEHGYVVEPKSVTSASDAMSRLIDSPADRHRMGQAAGQLHASRLTWDANASRMIQLFHGAVSCSTAGSA